MKLDAFREAQKIVFPRVNRVMRAGGLELNRRIVLKTPVDSGRARANWNASQNEEDPSADQSATSAQIGAKLAANEKIVSGIVFTEGTSLLLTNGLNYIDRLEAGSSGQAPAGMVVVSVQEVKPILESLAEAEGLGE